MKLILAHIFYYTGISWLFFFLSRIVYGDHIRVINYHGTPSAQKGQFEKHLQWYKKWYENITYKELIAFLSGHTTKNKKPGLIISFDDGKRSNFDIAKPLLEKHQFTGWFFVPAAWIEASNESQRILQEQDKLLQHEYPDGRLIIDKLELEELGKKHVIGCHTMNHHRMTPSDTEQLLVQEVCDSKLLIEKLTGERQTIFCWVGGEERHYTKKAADIISKAGYEVSFTTNTFPILKNENPLKLERSNIETNYPISLVLFQLSGLMDLLYISKRRRLRTVFGAS